MPLLPPWRQTLSGLLWACLIVSNWALPNFACNIFQNVDCPAISVERKTGRPRHRRGLSGKSYPAIYSNYDSLRRLDVHYVEERGVAYLRSRSRMGRAGISARRDFRKRAIAKITFYISSYILIIRKPRVYQLTVITRIFHAMISFWPPYPGA